MLNEQFWPNKYPTILLFKNTKPVNYYHEQRKYNYWIILLNECSIIVKTQR